MALVNDPDIFDPSNSTDVYNMMQSQSAANNAFNAEQVQKQLDFQQASNAKAMDFSHKEAEINRSWQEYMSNTAYQRQVKDMVKAGLNPVLGVSNSGASVGSGATAQAHASQGAAAAADTSINGAMSNFVAALINNATAKETMGMSTNAARYTSELAHAASVYGSQLAAGASRYGADAAVSGILAQLDWQREYNQLYNPLAYLNQLAEWITGDHSGGSAVEVLLNQAENLPQNLVEAAKAINSDFKKDKEDNSLSKSALEGLKKVAYSAWYGQNAKYFANGNSPLGKGGSLGKSSGSGSLDKSLRNNPVYQAYLKLSKKK